MIDLEFGELPRFIVVEGEGVEVETSFRAWLRFGRLAAEHGIVSPHILKGEPHGDWRPAAVEFYKSDNPCPRDFGGGEERAVDLALDGDYVVGAFQQAYGIDLTEGDMHWHRFLALLRSLPSDTKLMEIASYRTWRKRNTTQDAIMRELRREWALPAKDRPMPRVSKAAQDFLDANEQHIRELMREV